MTNELLVRLILLRLLGQLVFKCRNFLVVAEEGLFGSTDALWDASVGLVDVNVGEAGDVGVEVPCWDDEERLFIGDSVDSAHDLDVGHWFELVREGYLAQVRFCCVGCSTHLVTSSPSCRCLCAGFLLRKHLVQDAVQIRRDVGQDVSILWEQQRFSVQKPSLGIKLRRRQGFSFQDRLLFCHIRLELRHSSDEFAGVGQPFPQDGLVRFGTHTCFGGRQESEQAAAGTVDVVE